MQQRTVPGAPEPVAAPPFVVVVASSMGGVAALGELLGPLPAEFPAAVMVVQHLSPDHPSRLAAILRGRTALRVQDAAGGEAMRAGTVYLAPPARHLVVDAGGTLSLSDAPPVHFCRPSADVLFESAAAAFGERVVAVVLTGRDSDGSRGAAEVRRMGGSVLAQDPATAVVPSMPINAIRTGAVERVLPLAGIAPALLQLVSREHE
ncbi:MAG TPA: chemotaxis protein CheB [Longimicrobiaceae bacterium]|nr:chemotaxis protein CheB [Longimicrobiaceae bacterium]